VTPPRGHHHARHNADLTCPRETFTLPPSAMPPGASNSRSVSSPIKAGSTEAARSRRSFSRAA
jgi:hypothetical protein